MEPRLVDIGGARLEVLDRGAGEPVVFIQTALTADELLPLADQPSLQGYRTVLYHRRGYAGSSAISGAGSIARDAEDCRRLLSEIGVGRAHVLGVSYSGAVALQLAAEVPDLVGSVILIEPPPVHVPSAHEFRAANERLRQYRRDLGRSAALDEFLSMVISPDWRATTEELLPGSAQQMERDVDTFFDSDMPALLAWQFAAEDAQRITSPVLYVGGSDSGHWFDEVRQLMTQWFTNADVVTIQGADHSLCLTHPSDIAEAVSEFLRRHPLTSASLPG